VTSFFKKHCLEKKYRYNIGIHETARTLASHDSVRYLADSMSRWVLKMATVLSTVLLAVAMLLFLAGYVFSPWEQYLSFGGDFHIGVCARGLDSRIVFFNDAEYGPYRGSIIGIVGADGNVYPPLERQRAFGDSWGIYYRYFQWSDSTLWTLTVTLWYPIGLFAIIPMIRLLRSTVCRRTREPK